MNAHAKGLIAACSVIGAATAQVTPDRVTPEPAPIGVVGNSSGVLLSQPICDGEHPFGTIVQRGIYTFGASAPMVSLPPQSCAENYFAQSAGLGGFPRASFILRACRATSR